MFIVVSMSMEPLKGQFTEHDFSDWALTGIYSKDNSI